GGTEDRERGARIAENAGNGVIDLCGQLSIPGSASLIRQSAAILTHDTGMMHIASAFARPILSFWGNTVPAFGMTPYMPAYQDRSYLFEVKGLSCRPCSKLGYPSCPKGHFKCMWDIDIEQVIRTLDQVLEDR
ncbi:MAG: glycosyltransferase family 9 protein, partial [Flavobacteriales bacterium]